MSINLGAPKTRQRAYSPTRVPGIIPQLSRESRERVANAVDIPRPYGPHVEHLPTPAPPALPQPSNLTNNTFSNLPPNVLQILHPYETKLTHDFVANVPFTPLVNTNVDRVLLLAGFAEHQILEKMYSFVERRSGIGRTGPIDPRDHAGPYAPYLFGRIPVRIQNQPFAVQSPIRADVIESFSHIEVSLTLVGYFHQVVLTLLDYKFRNRTRYPLRWPDQHFLYIEDWRWTNEAEAKRSAAALHNHLKVFLSTYHLGMHIPALEIPNITKVLSADEELMGQSYILAKRQDTEQRNLGNS